MFIGIFVYLNYPWSQLVQPTDALLLYISKQEDQNVFQGIQKTIMQFYMPIE